MDENLRRTCLLDTGSQVSLWPPTSSATTSRTTSVRLTAANDTPIPAYGQQKRQIKIGGKPYIFMFLIAQVSWPILGFDFLQAFRMSLDLHNRRLIHSGRSTKFASATSKISGINVVQSSPVAQMVADYPEITDVSRASRSCQHGVECYINTTGTPIKTATRRLTPEKLKVAKKYFELMCAAGICQRSDSRWSSGLHMVQKKMA